MPTDINNTPSIFSSSGAPFVEGAGNVPTMRVSGDHTFRMTIIDRTVTIYLKKYSGTLPSTYQRHNYTTYQMEVLPYLQTGLVGFGISNRSTDDLGPGILVKEFSSRSYLNL